MVRYLICVLALLMSCFQILVSQGQNTFHKAYKNIQISGVDQTVDGGYILAGTAKATTLDTGGAVILKTDKYGEIEWARRYGKDNSFTEVSQTYDLGYICAGVTEEFGNGSTDFYAVKTDGFGDTLWSVTYGGAFIDQLFFIEELADSGFVMGGWMSTSATFREAVIVRLDKNGDTLWHKVMDYFIAANYNANGLVNVIETNDGGLLLSGQVVESLPALTFPSRAWLVKLDNGGNVEWTRTYGPGSGVGYSFGETVQTPDNGYVSVGFLLTTSLPVPFAILLAKVDSIGIVQWSKVYDNPLGTDVGLHLVLEDDESITLFGNTNSFGNGSSDILLMRTDANGVFQWAKTYGGCEAESPGLYYKMGELVKTNDNGYIFSTNSNSFNGGYVVKTDSIGNIKDSCFSTDVVFTETNIALILDSGLYVFQKGSATFPNTSMPIYNPPLVTEIECFPDTADFSWIKSIPCDGNLTDFSRIFTTYYGFPTDFLWNFDDPASGLSDTSTQEYPSHLFSSAGSYDVKLIINWVCTTDSVIYPVMVAPIYSIAVQDSICNGDSIFVGGSFQTFSGNYIDTFFSFFGCDSVVRTTLSLMPTPDITISGDSVICQGDSIQLTGTGGNNFLWSPSMNISNDSIQNPLIYPNTSTTYSLFSSIGLCSDIDSIYILVNPLPMAATNNDTTICAGGIINLQANGGDSYVWLPPTGLNNNTIQNPAATPNLSTTYYVLTTNNCGTDTASTTITVESCEIFIPNAFSPNGDGVNDVFRIRGDGIDNILLKIYNRWGNNVFQINNINEAWDGTRKGEILNKGVYVYHIMGNFINGEVIDRKGNVSLVR